jgi:hypothetical protein
MNKNLNPKTIIVEGDEEGGRLASLNPRGRMFT